MCPSSASISRTTCDTLGYGYSSVFPTSKKTALAGPPLSRARRRRRRASRGPAAALSAGHPIAMMLTTDSPVGNPEHLRDLVLDPVGEGERARTQPLVAGRKQQVLDRRPHREQPVHELELVVGVGSRDRDQHRCVPKRREPGHGPLVALRTQHVHVLGQIDGGLRDDPPRRWRVFPVAT